MIRLARGVASMTDVAQAFVPGHVTGFFTTNPDPDPTKAGSRGGGIALSDGVTVTVRPADEVSVVLNGTDIEMEAVERVLDALEVRAAVRGVTDLPLGSGFGVSGAMAPSPTGRKDRLAPVWETWWHRPVAAFRSGSNPVVHRTTFSTGFPHRSASSTTSSANSRRTTY
jgi:hypothetical protein